MLKLRMLTLFVALLGISVPGHSDPAFISGQLMQFDPASDKLFIDLEAGDLLEPVKYQLLLTEDGRFEAALNLSDTVEIQLAYGALEISLLMLPGDSVVLTIAGWQEVADPGALKVNCLNGKLAQANRYMLEARETLATIYAQATNAFAADKSLPEMTYQAARLGELAVQLATMQNYLRENSIEDPLFRNWATAQLTCRAGIDLATFPFTGKINTTLTDTAAYFDFIHKTPLDDKGLRYFRIYQTYIQTLRTTVGIMVSLNPYYKNKAAEQKNNGVEPCLAVSNQAMAVFFRWSAGYGRSCLAANYLYERAKRCPAVLVAYETEGTAIFPIDFRGKLCPAPDDTLLNLPVLVENYPVPEAVKAQIRQVLSAGKGKPVLLDFWVEGCGPCLQEIPYLNQLADSLQGRAEVIFLAGYMSQDRWLVVRERLQIKNGIHFLLGKNELAFFERYCRLYGFPHHVFLRPDGNIEQIGGFRADSPESTRALQARLLEMVLTPSSH